MLDMLLSYSAALSLIAVGAYAVIKQRTSANIFLMLTVVLLAGIVLADQHTLTADVDYELFRRVSMFLEGVLPAALLLCTMTFARKAPLRELSRSQLVLVSATMLFPVSLVVFPIQDFFYSPDFQRERMIFLGNTGYWFYTGLMTTCIISLVNIEATFVSTRGSDRWKVKYEIVGMASILAALVFYYSQGLLYRTMNMNLMPVRSAVIIIASLLVLYAKIFRGNGVRIAVSRTMLYRSFTLLIVGFYLIALGLVGEGMKYFDIAFGNYLLIFIAFAAGIALLVLILSEQIRRQIKVFISKNFYAHKHDYRRTWLELSGRLAACRSLSDMESAILAVYRETFGLKGASLYLFDQTKGVYEPAANRSLPTVEDGLRASAGLISYFRDRNRVWNLYDREYEPTKQEAAFGGSSGARLVVPLICNEQVEGLVVLGDQIAPEQYIYEDFDLMKVIARQLALLFSNLRMSEELTEARELAAMARISSFIVHDLKNLAHTLSLVLDNADVHIGNAEFQRDMISTIRNTLDHMKRLTQKLKALPVKGGIHRERCDLFHLSSRVCEALIRTKPGVDLVCRGASAASIVDKDEMTNVIHNLVQNGIDAAGELGTVTVETGTDNGRVYLKVSDTGCGMTKDFLQRRVFKPFQTTKEKGLGIGLYQCKQIIESFGGTIEAKSEAGNGSEFVLYLPADDTRSRVTP